MCKKIFDKFYFIIFAVILTMCVSAIGVSAAPQDMITYELEEYEFAVDDGVWIETPYTHGALPVESAVNLNFMGADRSISTKFNVAAEGLYQIDIGYVTNSDGGVFDCYIDGVKLDNKLYFNTSSSWVYAKTLTGWAELAAGEHTITFTSTEGGGSYCAIIDALILRPFEDSFVYEFEGCNWDKSSNDIHLEPNYAHSALPVSSVVFTNLYNEGKSISSNSLLMPQDGNYELTLSAVLGNSHGNFRLYIDDVQIGDVIVTFRDSGWVQQNISLGQVELEEGQHNIKIECDASSEDHTEFRLDSINFVKTTPVDDNPPTGDIGNIAGLIVLLCMSFAGSYILCKKRVVG